MTAPRVSRDHPLDELVPYLLGELDPMARAAVDGHLDRCAPCRAELARLSEGFVAAVEALPPTPPSDDVWGAIAGRIAAEPPRAPAAAPRRASGRDAPTTGAATPASPTRRAPRQRGAPRRHGAGWSAGGLVASLALAAALGVWGAGQRQVALDVRAELAAARAVAASRTTELAQEIAGLEALVGALSDEQSSVARWLSEPEVTVTAIAGDGDAVGAVLYRADGTALVVMRDAPGSGQSLQAWGVADGAVTSLGAFEGRVLEVSTEGFEAVAISLEPLGGSATPTEVLGAAPRS